jgi:hypothetical protein
MGAMNKEVNKMPTQGISIMHDWQNCDGYVKDVDTALVAMSLSIFTSIILILFIERVKLLFYQKAE